MNVNYLGNKNADKIIIWMSDARELPIIEEGISKCELKDYCLAVVTVNNWNKDLSPWKAPGVFGEDFGEGADETLDWILSNIINNDENKKYYK